ncbi:MAG: T9SS type A sorting domain-containing protein, partial [Saprospiraceae bacterium]
TPGEYGAIMEYTSEAGLVNTSVAESRSRDNDIESIFIEGEDLNVFPNPVAENLTVQYKAKTTGTLSLYHVSGVRVRTMALNAGNSTYNMNMEDLADGFYLLKIEENGAFPVTKQVVKTAVR